MSQVAQVQLVENPGAGGDKLRLRTWIEVQLVGEDDQPIPNVRYVLTLPGGDTRTGTLDANGCVRIDGLPAGTCKVSFPDLDQEAWVPVEQSA
jgi:hypothetical protein